ncbi:glutamate carboxypeptidase [Cupriavidus agavae]|uniref:Glutamate carboxypeptidase n=1 Tax=Cupriavidus agavae TaxID=1001822 RepID=A0A4Q7RDY6_9BURK|nr:glutamate carboxypeptidase [Cupriavidus agavae]RZT31376.1 glutamate carboxypeptidase [Cupriavidus agavae]
MRRLILTAAALGAAVLVSSGCGDSAAAPATYDSALDTASRSQQAPTVAMLEALVNIESGPGDAVGLAQMGDYLAGQLVALGATVTRHKAADGTPGDNIVGTLRGTGTRHILLMAHMDTVYPRGFLKDAPFRVDGNRAYGPGIADDKGGIAVILNTLALLNARSFREYGTLTVLFNTDEETGSFGSRELIQSLSASHDYVLSHEPSAASQESFGLATSGIAHATATIRGRASHAGVAPELGVNALTEAAALILRTQDIDNKDREIRFNWTLASAGSASNAIPAVATLTADMRYGRNQDLDAITAMLNERAQQKRLPEAEITIDVLRGRPAFNASEGGQALAARGQSIYNEVGGRIEISNVRIGGGSDAAYAALSGKPVLEGMGLPGAGYHTNADEYIMIDAIPRRLYLGARMIMDLSLGR